MNNSIERKLEECYQHILPYIHDDDDEEIQILKSMCERCERYNGKEHDYSECRNEPCFICYLGFEYMCWDD